MTQERATIRGVVATVFYSGPSFSAGRLRTANGTVVKFAGKVFVKETIRFAWKATGRTTRSMDDSSRPSSWATIWR